MSGTRVLSANVTTAVFTRSRPSEADIHIVRLLATNLPVPVLQKLSLFSFNYEYTPSRTLQYKQGMPGVRRVRVRF